MPESQSASQVLVFSPERTLRQTGTWKDVLAAYEHSRESTHMQPARLALAEDSFKQQLSQTAEKEILQTNSFYRARTDGRNKSAYGPAVITYSSPAHPPTPHIPHWSLCASLAQTFVHVCW